MLHPNRKCILLAGILSFWLSIEFNFLWVFGARAFEESSWQTGVVSRAASLRHLDHGVRALKVLEVSPNRGRGG